MQVPNLIENFPEQRILWLNYTKGYHFVKRGNK